MSKMLQPSIMRTIFHDRRDESFFRQNGFLVFDLLTDSAIRELWSFYSDAFEHKREVHPFAQDLRYYISIFDKDRDHKTQVDHLISNHVRSPIETVIADY